ncbi:zinc finger protein 467-like [Eriocheir sinensis]|uniref:zinc finger protein 467-like n=1 Tax=Eriocheir sinensis TaxID=95602 RepID=UPI0021C752EC|nr:zinc finger protein 467-like [Eriocheir sinensis]
MARKSCSKFTRKFQNTNLTEWAEHQRAKFFLQELSKDYIDKESSLNWLIKGTLHYDQERLIMAAVVDASKNVKSELKRHILAHTGIRPHECLECDKRFFSKSELNSHVVTHSDLREFKCDVCEKHFKTKKIIAKHMKIHFP